MKDQDIINEKERHEAATETPIGEVKDVGEGEQRNIPLAHFPSGADGTEPGEPDKVEELKKRVANLKACNDRSYAKMVRIAELANECVQRTTHAAYMPGQYGQDYRTFGKAISDIRTICGRSLADVEPDYEMLARELTRDGFNSERLAKAIEALASEKPVDYPTFYTPGWLCEIAKWLQGKGTKPVDADKAAKKLEKGKKLDTVRLFAKTPKTVVLQVKLNGVRDCSAELEEESTSHLAQAFLYDGKNPVCKIQFFNGYQSRGWTYKIVRHALKGLMSRCGKSHRYKSNSRAAENQELINKELA